jgi:hypothetical protein
MDVIGFLCVSLCSRTVADAHAHVQRLVSVVNMETMLEECNTEEQRSVVHFCRQNDLMQGIFIYKCYLFTVGLLSKVVQNWAEKFSQRRSKL